MTRLAVGRRSHGWRTRLGLNADELAWTALMIGGVLVAAMFMDP